MRRLLHTAAFVTAVAFSAPAFATDWNMATAYPDAEFHTKNIIQFAEDVKEKTGGELTIIVHSGQSLFKHPEIKRSVQNQLVPMGEILIGNLMNEDPIYGADNIPFLVTSYEGARKLYEVQKPMIEERLMKDGIRLLYAVPWPGQGIYTKEPVSGGADLKGKNFRTYNALTARMAELLGAVPAIVEAVEIPQAFSTGIVDAMVTSAATGVRTKAWDFSKHFYDTNAWMPKNVIMVNEMAFQSLPEDQQKAVLEAAAEAETRGWAMSEEVATSSTEELGKSMTVEQASEQLSADLAKVGDTMAQEWAATAGEDGQKLLDALK